MSDYKGQTDEVTTITLTSTIEEVAWSRQLSVPGAEVVLEVFTHYVGDGSEIQIRIKDENGKKFDKIKTKIAGNRRRQTITVPDKAKEALYAEVKLPKHKIKAESPALQLLPLVEIEKLKWSQQKARRGDVLTISADLKGAPDDSEAEVQIWEHDDVGAHDLITKFPVTVKDEKIQADWEFEYYEDTDDIPNDEEAESGYQAPEYFFRVNYHGASAESDLLGFKDYIEIKLKNSKGEPLGGEHYTIFLPDGQEKDGDLDNNGYAKVDDVPPGKYRVAFENYPDIEVA